jgi:PAS domain S-box-containing protein
VTVLTTTQTGSAQARTTESLLRLATRLSRLGAWVVDVPEMTVACSAETLAIYEIEDDSAPTFDRMASLVHPGCRETVRQAMQLCMQHGLPFDLEVRAYTACRRPIWLRLIGQAERDVEGRVKCIQGAVQDISERKDAAERVRELSEQLTTTLESVSDAFIMLDRRWRFSYVNRAAERLFNMAREQLLGKINWEVFPKSVGSVFQREFERALAQSTTVRFEAFSDSLGRWLQVVAYPSPQGLAVYCRDVTESRNDQLAQVESEERYRLLFETSADAILQMSPDGRVLRANSSACAMFAMSEQELRKIGRADLVAPEETRLAAILEARNETGKAIGELTMVRADESRFDAEVTTSRYRMSNGTILTNIVLRDITERLQFQQDMLLLNAELGQRVRQRTAELETANAELKGFAHSLAHDLRAPIATIESFSGILKLSLAKAGSERDQHYVRRIHAAAQRMDEFVEALLSLARISQAQMRRTEVDLSAIAESILADLRERDPLRVVVCTAQKGLRAAGDARLLKMALENLLGNAWKFTSKRARAKITFDVQPAPEGELVYCVKDNGAGFDATYSEKLFGNFQRLHRESEFPGTGIGLANVRRIVERHGGRVWAESVEGEGASFKFTLGTAPLE